MKLDEQFLVDVEKGAKGEKIVLDYLCSKLGNDFIVKNVSLEKKYNKLGDIIVENVETKKKHYFEVKTDDVIAKTQNVMCEESVYWYSSNITREGFMYSHYQFFCIVSRQERKIYVINFKILQKIYKECGKRFTKKFSNQTSTSYLVPLCKIREHNGLLGVLNY